MPSATVMTVDDGSDFRVDLTNCDREPIHALGNIQPFGFLVSLNQEWLICRVSQNIAHFSGREPDELWGKPLIALFTEHAIHAIRNRMAMLRGPDAIERLFCLTLIEGRPPFDVAVHFSRDNVVIEAEFAVAHEMEAASVVRAMIARLGRSSGLSGLLREGARQVRALTGFDRVMVYQFDEQGAGEVVAECLQPGTASFLGQHFPASDIPKQARALYVRNIFRVIADVSAAPVAIHSAGDLGKSPLDQSVSVLRAVSPIHLEYLRNMGVAASLSISIIVDGKLWGMFACHHYAPRLPSFSYRTAAELFGQLFSLMLESREHKEQSHYEAHARASTDKLMAAVAQDEDLLENATWLGDSVIDIIPADGVAVFLRSALSLSGLTPSRSQCAVIARFLTSSAASEVFATDFLQDHLPEAASFAAAAAGMIAIPLSQLSQDYIVLFRKEQSRLMNWAGHPDKQIEYGPHGSSLTPRKSFDVWSEQKKGHSIPITSAERRIAESLRISMREVLSRLSGTAGEARVKAHERQELLIAELNHRVRNILALIRGLISQTRTSSGTLEGFVGNLDSRIQALARAHNQITGERWGPAGLRDLLETEAGAFLGAQRQRVKLDGPNVLIQPGAFTAIALIFHELMTNAVKYGALSDNGVVLVGWRLDEEAGLKIEWREEGGPPVKAPTRRGFGSIIIEQSMPYDLGGKAELDYAATGLQANFLIPARHIAGVSANAGETPNAALQTVVKLPLLDLCVLLVEDSMIIAMDAEDTIRQLGAEKIVTAPSVEYAKTALQDSEFDFALLDVNLGSGNSAEIADLLAARGTPFAFATGYGEGSEFLARHPVPVLNKPYSAPQLASLLASLGF
jgi:light-regulated signal transduction histidine kinase (bacteriophytochrome)/CheY-like chemotaxis protein